MTEPDEKAVEEASEDDGDEYYFSPPEPLVLTDGDSQFVIFDPQAFAEKYELDGVQYWQGKAFGLCAKTRQLVEIGTPPAKQKPKLVQ